VIPYTHKLYICWAITSFDKMYAITCRLLFVDGSSSVSQAYRARQARVLKRSVKVKDHTSARCRIWTGQVDSIIGSGLYDTLALNTQGIMHDQLWLVR
jgi:hypothetical protein